MEPEREEVEEIEQEIEEVEESEEVETGEEEEPTPDADETEEKPKKSAEAGQLAALKAEREKRQALEREVADIKAKLQPAAPQHSEEDEAKAIEAEVLKRIGEKPTLAACDFDTEKFADVLSDWKQEKSELTREFKEQIKTRKETAQRNSGARQTFIAGVKDTGTKAYEDFSEVAYLPEGAIHIFAQLDNAADVAYALGKDTAAAKKIGDLLSKGHDPSVFIGQFSAKVTAKKPLTSKEVRKTPTQTQRPGQGGETSAEAKAVKAAREKAIASGNFTEYLERIGAY